MTPFDRLRLKQFNTKHLGITCVCVRSGRKATDLRGRLEPDRFRRCHRAEQSRESGGCRLVLKETPGYLTHHVVLRCRRRSSSTEKEKNLSALERLIVVFYSFYRKIIGTKSIPESGVNKYL